MTNLLDLRLQVAAAQVDVRGAKDAYELAKAEAEQRAVDAGVSGKNEAERTRAFTLALSRDRAFQQALRAYRTAEAQADQAEAYLEAARDDRRNQEWFIRARLVDALMGTGITSDTPGYTGDSVFDDTLMTAVDHAMHAAVAHR